MQLVTITGGPLQTNCHLLIKDEKVISFDFVPELNSYLAKNKLKLEAVFITHIHFDHIAGLGEYMSNNQGLLLYMSKPASDGINNPAGTLSIYYDGPGSSKNSSNIDVSRITTLDDGESIEWNGVNILSVSMPGHSTCSLSYIIKQLKSVITGDTIFYLSIGRSDFPGGNHETLIDSINKLFRLIDDNYKLLPGHGPSTNSGFEKKENSFL